MPNTQVGKATYGGMNYNGGGTPLTSYQGGVSVIVSPANEGFLTIQPSPGAITVRWPTNAVGFTLAQTTNLTTPSWADVPSAAAVVNTNYLVTLPADPGGRIFRLHKP